MYLAVTLQYTDKAHKNNPTVVTGGFGSTAEQAGGKAEQALKNTLHRTSYPNYDYVTLVGRAEFQAVPPEQQIELKPFKE